LLGDFLLYFRRYADSFLEFSYTCAVVFAIIYEKLMFSQRSPEKPCLNDVTEVGTWRQTFVGVAIFLAVLTLLPVWDELADELGIGLVTTL
jgi:hypothetical protein